MILFSSLFLPQMFEIFILVIHELSLKELEKSLLHKCLPENGQLSTG